MTAKEFFTGRKSQLSILLLLVGGNALLSMSLPPCTVRELAEFEVERRVGCMRSPFEDWLDEVAERKPASAIESKGRKPACESDSVVLQKKSKLPGPATQMCVFLYARTGRTDL